MENFHLHFSRRKLHALLSVLERPDFMWRIVVATTVLLTLITAALSLLSYGWATRQDTPIVEGAAAGVVSKEDIRAVIDLYNAKQKRFEALKNTRPTAPVVDSEASSIVPETTPLENTSTTTPAGVLP